MNLYYGYVELWESRGLFRRKRRCIFDGASVAPSEDVFINAMIQLAIQQYPKANTNVINVWCSAVDRQAICEAYVKMNINIDEHENEYLDKGYE